MRGEIPAESPFFPEKFGVFSMSPVVADKGPGFTADLFSMSWIDALGIGRCDFIESKVAKPRLRNLSANLSLLMIAGRQGRLMRDRAKQRLFIELGDTHLRRTHV